MLLARSSRLAVTNAGCSVSINDFLESIVWRGFAVCFVQRNPPFPVRISSPLLRPGSIGVIFSRRCILRTAVLLPLSTPPPARRWVYVGIYQLAQNRAIQRCPMSACISQVHFCITFETAAIPHQLSFCYRTPVCFVHEKPIDDPVPTKRA